MRNYDCDCRACLSSRAQVVVIGGMILPAEAFTVPICGQCGNKRCPHATDHRNECSGSNEPGQKGSAYEGMRG